MATFMTDRNLPAEGTNAVSRLHNDIDRLFGGFFNFPSVSDFFENGSRGLIPQMDVKSDEKGYTFSVELPGVEPEAVKIELEGKTLKLSGEKKEEVADKDTKHVQERRYGSFMRSFTLPEDADAESLKAVAKNGVLTLQMNRRADEAAKTRTIEVQKA
ncbi:MAG: Hsp20/alpha crystallin family protein [Desulfovibrionaceae bacterium]|nr:Hsp20/alpha crystallin family protein [Desulfovibrionaceae bacterium]